MLRAAALHSLHQALDALLATTWYIALTVVDSLLLAAAVYSGASSHVCLQLRHVHNQPVLVHRILFWWLCHEGCICANSFPYRLLLRYCGDFERHNRVQAVAYVQTELL
jgi:hypothetical protein